MKEKSKDQLVLEYKTIRARYFNVFEENMEKFNDAYKDHPLYTHVIKHLDKSFKEVNQIADDEISKYLKDKHEV